MELPVLEDSDYYKVIQIAIDQLEEDKFYSIYLDISGIDGTVLVMAGGDSTHGENFSAALPVGKHTICLRAENISQANYVSLWHFGVCDTEVFSVTRTINPLADIYINR